MIIINNKKCLSTLIEITQLLAKRGHTYGESDSIAATLFEWLKQSRENYEYETTKDYVNKNKTNCVSNLALIPLNHID